MEPFVCDRPLGMDDCGEVGGEIEVSEGGRAVLSRSFFAGIWDDFEYVLGKPR